MSCVLLLAMLSSTVIAKEDVNARGKQRVSKSLGLDAKFLDINQIEFGVRNDGHLAYDPNAGGYIGFYYPKGQRNMSIVYTAGLWVVGKVGNDIRSAACQYSTEYQPGMILPNGSADDYTDPKYEVFKYNLGDVIDQAALDQGCPTQVMGDQMLYMVYNDKGTHEYLGNGLPLGIEVQQTVWGYNRTGALGSTIFSRFRVINKGGNQIDSCYLGIFYDPDLGDSNDDAAGADTTLGICYVYNGDGYDADYGATVPAMASDFFQGPIVPAPGETAILPDGTIYPDSKILPQTSVFMFANGVQLSGWNDPDARYGDIPTQQYYFLQGRRGNGLWNTDPGTGKATKFPLAGDPVTGTGWTWKDLADPQDIRMGNGTGPFTLAAGDTQDIVLGIVVGQGLDYLGSITNMRLFDETAQLAYDRGFQLPSPPPAPVLTIGQLDGELMLTWDNEAENFSQGGYELEGYIVYQGQSTSGPWKKIASFDKVNGVKDVWDREFNASFGDFVDVKTMEGSDNGLQYSYLLTSDKITNTTLVNGKPYYFAVTAYAYNDDPEPGDPKVLECGKVSAEGIPQKPVMDTEYTADIGDVLTVTKSGAYTDSWVTATVVDPSRITGHDYRVDVKYNADSSAVLWDLVDVTTGEVRLANQTNITGDDAYAVVDGIQTIVKIITPANYGWDDTKGYRGNGWDYDGSRNITGVNWGGHNLFAGMDLGEIFWGPNDVTPNDYGNIKVDFWNAASNTADPVAHPWSNCQTFLRPGYAPNGLGVFPGAAYMMEPPDNPVPRRLNLQFVESDLVDHFWSPIAADNGDGLGGREYLFIMNSDYVEDPTTLYSTADDLNIDALVALWVHNRGSYTGDEEWTLYCFMTHPIKIGLTDWTFSTSGYEPVAGETVGKERLSDVNVFPNPYFAHNSAEGTFYTQFVTFNGLPEDNCTIRIFTLDGQVVNTITHDNGTPFERWYLQNESEVPVASGMYLVHITTEYGNRILKLAVINRGAFFRNF